MFHGINAWLGAWEPSWLFVVLHLEALSGWFGAYVLWKRLNVLSQKKAATRRKKEETFECLTNGEMK